MLIFVHSLRIIELIMVNFVLFEIVEADNKMKDTEKYTVD